MNEVRMYNILLGSISTEKSVIAAEKSKQLTFKVIKDANKTEIKQAIEKIFNVAVKAVRVINTKGKAKSFRNHQGAQSSWKKALVTLHEGHDINLAEFN